jgi:multidrug resistance efflux pump
MADPIITKGDAKPEQPAPAAPALVDAQGRPLTDPQVAQGPETEPAPSKTIRTSGGVLAIMAVVAVLGVLLILWAWQIWPFSSTVVTTENSYVRGQITVLAPQVNGYVAEVMVNDYDRVKAGQPLLRIDDRIYRQQLEQARGQLELAKANLDNARQTIAQNVATVDQRRADVFATEAERDRAQADDERVTELAERGSVSLRQRDQTRATARSGSANVRKAESAVRIAQEQVTSARVQREGLVAQVATAQAQVRLAKINLANTIIRAPRAGQISEASVRQGQYVAAGSQLLFLVPETLWVVANFKETQTRYVRLGQPVRFTVDALGDDVLTGRVQRFAPATGSEFSVLRPDNASGNFTKVVQRIPVRIAIDPNQPVAGRLRPGMSVITRIDTAGVSR